MLSGKSIASSLLWMFISVTAAHAQAAPPTEPKPSASDAPVVIGSDGDLHLNVGHQATASGAPLYTTVVEDWSKLKVGTSHLTSEPPVMGQVSETDDFTRTLLQVKWRPGDPIDLYVILPKGVKNPPAVLYLYGHDEDTDRFKDDRWCTRVTSGGVAAIGFVSALTGQRFHDRPMKQTFVSELQEALGSTVHDVKFILDYLATRGDIDMSRIGMFGQGSGGTIAILAAVADPRIKVVDALDPWGYWPVWLAKSSVVQDDANKAEFLKPAFLRKVAPLDPVRWLPQLKTAKLRIQQPMDAAPVPRACKNQIKLALPKGAELKRFDTVSEMAGTEGGGMLFQWVKEQVKDIRPAAMVAETKTSAKGGL
jgi:hypothetical protein